MSELTEQNQCQGWRRHGGAFTLGPVKWEQCTDAPTVMLDVKGQGKMAACPTCWQECIDNKIAIVTVTPIKANGEG